MSKENNLTDFLRDIANRIRIIAPGILTIEDLINPKDFVDYIAGTTTNKEYTNLNDFLKDLADTIRTKRSGINNNPIDPQDFADYIAKRNDDYDYRNPYTVIYDGSKLLFGGYWKEDSYGNITVSGGSILPPNYSPDSGMRVILIGSSNQPGVSFKNNDYNYFSIKIDMGYKSDQSDQCGKVWFTGTNFDDATFEYDTELVVNKDHFNRDTVKCKDNDFNELFASTLSLMPVIDFTGFYYCNESLN